MVKTFTLGNRSAVTQAGTPIDEKQMSARNQQTACELEQFFRSLRDLLMLSLEVNLSFDSAQFLCRRLDGFERALNVLSSRLRVSFPIGSTTIWPRCSLTYCQPTEAALRGLIWFGFAWRGRGTTFNRQPAEWVLCFRPRLHISETQSLLEVLGISLGNHRKKPECFRKNFAEAKARAWFH